MSHYEDMQTAWKALDGSIEWHCRRHGVIRGVARKDEILLNEVITYFMGPKSSWWDGKGNVEFSNTTKVYPPQKKPWEWCGTSVLFPNAQKADEAQKIAARSFRVGDSVYFFNKSARVDGIVAGIRKRVTVIIPGSDIKWYIPATELYNE